MMTARWKFSWIFGGLLCVSTFFQNVLLVASDWSGVSIQDEYTMAYINMSYVNASTGKEVLNPFDFDDPENGKFGAGKISTVAGVVLHVRSRNPNDEKINHHGCDPLVDPIPEGPWIALIKRGNCNFDVKLRNAQARNAVAMVVYDHEDRPTLEKMGLGTCKNCSIPGVFTYKKIGEYIANISDSGTRVDMVITVGQTCTRPYGGINRTSVLFVSISFIVLMIISLAWLVFYYVQRFRYLHAKDRLAQRLCNAAKKALAKIPTRNIKTTDREITGESECCAVCIEYYSSGDVLRTLPCRHEFHKGCVDPWLLEHRTCPMCKMDILKYYGYIFTGSQESILHLDMEDGIVISSESRETDSPTRDEDIQHEIRCPEQSVTSSEHPQTSYDPCQCSRQSNDDLICKPSAISVTVMASPRIQNNIKKSASSDSKGLNLNYFRSQLCECDGVKTPVVDQQHPMCYLHRDGENHHKNVENSTADVSGVTASHQPLIHREDSGTFHVSRSHSNLNNSRQDQNQAMEISSPVADESHKEDFINYDNSRSQGSEEPATLNDATVDH